MSSPQTKNSSYPVLYSSGIGSISAVLVSTPFDVVKNYLQVRFSFQFLSKLVVYRALRILITIELLLLRAK